jgi:hypothetical protein
VKLADRTKDDLHIIFSKMLDTCTDHVYAAKIIEASAFLESVSEQLLGYIERFRVVDNEDVKQVFYCNYRLWNCSMYLEIHCQSSLLFRKVLGARNTLPKQSSIPTCE